MIRPVSNRRLEYNALVISFAMAFGLDAIVADGPFFPTLDPPLAACQTACLGSLPQLWI